MASETTNYRQLTAFPHGWDNLDQIDAALKDAHLDVSSGKRMITIQGGSFPFQGIIDRVYSLRPYSIDDFNGYRPYLSIARKLKTISDEAPAEQKNLCERVLNLYLSLCGCICTASCRESSILNVDALLTADDLLESHRDFGM